MKNIFAIFALFALLVGTVFAQGPSVELKKNVLEMQYNKIGCGADFRIDILELMKTKLADKVDAAKIDGMIAAGKEDLAALKTAADAGDRQAYNTALKELGDDLKEVGTYYVEVVHGLSAEDKKQLRGEYKAIQDKRTACVRAASLDLGAAQRDYISAWVDKGQNITDRLRARGLEVSKLDEIVSAARERHAKIADAVATGNGTVVNEKVKELRGEHLHLWARFHVERMRAILDALKDRAAEKGLSAEFDEIVDLLNRANDKVQEGQPYNEGEFKEVKDL
ncbi:MAG: hypothetical protein HZA83_02630, partial [Thaumarchaeota archaeon]|nr:hypothetical protein [Nitrososphaerota archaeon]